MSRLPTLRRIAAFASASAVLLAASATGTASADDVSCSRVAAPGGSDSAAGTVDAPFASAQRLASSLAPGETGCLRGGTYHGDVSMYNGGSSESARVVLRSYPGERATIAGRVTVNDQADYVTVEDLNLDGHDGPRCGGGETCVLPSPTVNGDHVIFQDNDVTNGNVGICFALGSSGYGRAGADVIQRNRIHDCGRRDPVSNHDHGIYLAYADGTKILDNVIYDNADRGIQLYPDAQGTLVKGNVIDGNGEGLIFSGAGSTASNDNIVENNVITNSRIRHDVESYYPDVVGTGNKVRNNCVYGGSEGPIGSAYGFTVETNLKLDPLYVDRGAKDFRLAPGSPCAAILAGADVPSTPSDTGGGSHTDHPHGGKPTDPPPVSTGDSAQVSLTRATLERSHRHGGRWRLRLAGHVRGAQGTLRGFVQVLRGGSWQRIAARRLESVFHVSVDPRIPAFHSARVTRVRIVVRGVTKSRPVPASVRRR